MPKSATKTVRKLPRQARAQASVNAVLEATVQVLERDGVDAATTTRIAEVAGVSIAATYAACPGLHRMLAIEGLRVAKAERVYAFDPRVISIIRHFLTASPAPVRRRNVDAAAFVAYQSVRATMLASLLERPPGLGQEELIAEVADLVLRYPVRSPATPRTGRSAAVSAKRPRLSTAR